MTVYYVIMAPGSQAKLEHSLKHQYAPLHAKRLAIAVIRGIFSFLSCILNDELYDAGPRTYCKSTPRFPTSACSPMHCLWIKYGSYFLRGAHTQAELGVPAIVLMRALNIRYASKRRRYAGRNDLCHLPNGGSPA